MPLISTAGDNGDVIFLLCILRDLPGGPHTLLIEEKDELTATGRTSEGPANLLRIIKDLVESQPYIKECRLIQSTDAPFWRSGGFRKAGLHSRTEPLMEAHLAHLNQTTGIGLKVDHSRPWLVAYASRDSRDRVVINRTARYHNNLFPWKSVVGFYGESLLFVGHPHEHAVFCHEFGNVEYRPTENLKEVAELISGSRLFIGNQSCAGAISEGLKHDHIQETSPSIPDCIFQRRNVQHVWNGKCHLPSFGGSMKDFLCEGPRLDVGLVSEGITPPEWWQHPDLAGQFETFPSIFNVLASHPKWRGRPDQEVKDSIKAAQLDRLPDHYRPQKSFENVRMAMRHAGYII